MKRKSTLAILRRTILLLNLLLIAIGPGQILATAADTGLPDGYPATKRQKLSLNTGWQFHLGAVQSEPTAVAFDDASWEAVNVPHTFKLTSIFLDGSTDGEDQLTFHRWEGWYRRHFTVNAAQGEKVFLEFEGAHQVTDVWVNGRHVGQHSTGGYTPFHFDITDYVNRDGDNVVALKLDNTRNENIPPDGSRADYVLFSGLYRDIYLVVADPLHVTFPWEARKAGVFITTPTVNATNATVSVRTTVRNDHADARNCSLLTRIIDADGRVVRKLRTSAEIAAGREHTFTQVDGITEDLRLWSLEDPYLYRVNTTVFDGDTPVDVVENPLGVRKFELTDEEGVLLNGKPIELIGVNRHQQYPYVGDAVPNSLHWKDAVQMKKFGINTVRLAHYPHDNSFFEACDKLGLLITEEAPAWIELGNETFMDNMEQALRVTIRNHRNHPSVVIWGGGINHRGPIHRLHYAAKDEDPTRWTMSNSTEWTGLQNAGVTDIFSSMDYSSIPLSDRFLFAMEHSGSRNAERNQILISRYLGSPARIGLTVWSGHDSNTLHRNGGPSHLARWGVFDGFRIPKHVAYWYQSEMTSDPMVHIATDWNNAKTERVSVFSNCDQVELFLNGYSLGRQSPDTNPVKANLRHQPFTFRVVWEAGELTAKGIVDGKVVASHAIRSPEEPDRLTLTIDMDDRTFTADGSDMVMAYAHIRDSHGQTVIDSTQEVTFRVEGPGEIVGDASIGANPVKAERGIAAAMVRAGTEPGRITLVASAEGLRDVRTSTTSVAFEENVLAARARPIYEPLFLQADIGWDEAHIEDGWTGWLSDGSQKESYSFEVGSEINADIRSLRDGELTWSGIADVAGPLGRVAEDGIYTPAESGLQLSLTGLEAGTYQLRTYHHESRREIDGYRGDLPGPKASPQVTVLVDDASGSGRQITDSLRHSVGQSVGNTVVPEHTDLTIRANGEDAVTIRFTGEKGRLWINGLELREQLK